MYRYTLLLLLTLCGIAPLQAQENIPLGTWRTHQAYQAALQVEGAGEQRYCLTEGGVFLFDTQEQRSRPITRLDGLSAGTPSAIAYHAPSATLLIAYSSGNIDFWQQGRVFTLSSIANSTLLPPDRRIFHIYIQQQLAYLSTAFGVVVVDIARRELRESYQNIGPGGSAIEAYRTLVWQNRFFVASSQGILVAPLSSNLQFFGNYTRYEIGSGIPAESTAFLAAANSSIYAGIQGQGLFKWQDNDTWQAISPIAETSFQNIEGQPGALLRVCAGSFVYLIDASENVSILSDALITAPRSAWLGAGQQVWIADAQNTLLTNQEGFFRSFRPNGPLSATRWRGAFANGEIILLQGGFQNNNGQAFLRAPQIDIFGQGRWRTFSNRNTEGLLTLPERRDLSGAAYNLFDRKLYVTSFENGLLIKAADDSFEIIDNNTPNTPFAGANPVQLSDVKVDFRGDVWLTQYVPLQVAPSLHVRRRNGAWESFSFNTAARRPLQVEIGLNNYKWMRLEASFSAGGLWVFDEQGGRNKQLSTANGALPTNNILAMAIDLSGVLWLGTEDGVLTIFNPAEVFRDDFQAIAPIFQGRRLLRSERIQAIKIDPANRKWFATSRGVFLFDENLTRLLAEFNTQNSPLPSDNVLDLIIHENSGEIFFITEAGIASYRQGVSTATATFNNVKVFPNPVEPNYTGLVGIEGLAQNASVKITDVSGRLVFETRAQGGTATWNTRDYKGRAAETGVYFIFATNLNGEESFVAKIAIIR